MPPSRKTFIGSSGFSLDQSNRGSIQHNSIPASGLEIPPHASTLPPITAVPPLVSTPTNIGIPIQTNTLISGGSPSHIGGIPVVQNPNMPINTYYSTAPVGGSFLLRDRGVRGPVQASVLTAVPTPINTIPTAIPISNLPRPVTPSYKPLQIASRPLPITASNLPTTPKTMTSYTARLPSVTSVKS